VDGLHGLDRLLVNYVSVHSYCHFE
jgi:hypothetical protein